MQFKPHHNWMAEEESEGLSGAWKHKCKRVLSARAIGLLADCSVSFSWQAFSQLTDENMKLKFFMTDSCAEWRGRQDSARLGARATCAGPVRAVRGSSLCPAHQKFLPEILYQANSSTRLVAFFFFFFRSFFFSPADECRVLKDRGGRLNLICRLERCFLDASPSDLSTQANVLLL